MAPASDAAFVSLRLAQSNVDRHGVAPLVDVVSAGIASLPQMGPVDLLVANLPYVSEEEWDDLEPEIREYEPREALVPGATGYEAIDLLVETVAALARRPGAIALEIGAGQSEVVSRLVREAGYAEVEIRLDLAGHDRVVIGR